MIKRRAFLGGTLTAMSAGSLGAPSATAQAVIPAPAEPLVWPVVTKVPAGIRSFAGHTDTVPDIVGRIGTPAGLVIFTEGNHLMALLSDDILGAFPSWAKSQPRYAEYRRMERIEAVDRFDALRLHIPLEHPQHDLVGGKIRDGEAVLLDRLDVFGHVEMGRRQRAGGPARAAAIRLDAC